MSYIKQEAKFHPSSIDVGGWKVKVEFPWIWNPAEVDGVNLEETGLFVGIGIVGADKDLLFKSFPGLVQLFPLCASFFLSALSFR